MSVKLFVGNLPIRKSRQDIVDLFACVGTVASCEIAKDATTGRSRGFAFVEMVSKAESENAIAQLDGHRIDGHRIIVSLAGSAAVRSGEQMARLYSGSYILSRTARATA